MTEAPTARELRFGDLIWSHFSRPPLGGFDERVAAAADAGFAGIGLFTGEYARLRDDEGRDATALGATLAAHGVVLAEVEAVTGWSATDDEPVARCVQTESLAYELADQLGVRYLQAIGSFEGDVGQAIDGFGRLCDRAAPHGLLVGIEFLPFTNIATAADAQTIVDGCGRPNAGYCVDVWHHVRGANDWSLIAALDPARVFAIQLNDGTLEPALSDYKADCLANRLPPGEGEFGCAELLGALHDLGVDAPISLEVCSTELWSAPAAAAARAAADGARRTLDEAGLARP